MKTLCLHNTLARKAAAVNCRMLLSDESYWGEIQFHTLRPNDLIEPVWLKYIDRATKVVVIGGDGTLHHVIQHIVDKPVTLYHIPSGTANDFANWIGLPIRPIEASLMLKQGKTISYDTISANGRHVLSGGGFGIGYAIARSATALKHHILGRCIRSVFQSKIYSMLLLWHCLVTRSPSRHLYIGKNGKVNKLTCQAVLFTNQPSLGKDIMLAPETRSNDGLFHLLTFKNPHSVSALCSIVRIKAGKSHLDRHLVRTETELVHIDSENSFPAFADGELLPEASSWRLCSHRNTLKIRVPEKFNG